jgi:hypothetical protein
MPQLKTFLLLLLAVFILASCKSHATKNDSKGNSADASAGNGSDSSYGGDASLSYTIGDRQVAIKSTLVTGGKNWIALFLNNVVNKTADGTVKINITNYLSKEVFNFTVANKGSTSILHYSPSLAETKNKGTYMSPKYVNYYADAVTVNITSINATRGAGTFSGKFIEPDGKASISIADGKFDLPFADDKTGQ